MADFVRWEMTKTATDVHGHSVARKLFRFMVLAVIKEKVSRAIYIRTRVYYTAVLFSYLITLL